MRKKEFKSIIVPSLLVIIIAVITALLWFNVVKHKFSKEQPNIEKQNTLESLKKVGYYYDKGNYVESIRQYKNIIETEPQNYGAYIGLGNSYLQLGIYDEAVKTFEKTYGIGYHDFRTYYGLGLVYYRTEEYKKAYINLKQAHELNPNNDAVISYLINTYNAVGLYDDAINLSKNKLETDPNNSHYYRKIAIAYFLKGNLTKALEYSKKAVMIYNDYPGNDLALATIYLSLGEKENALTEFKAALLQPQHPTYEGLALTYSLLGEKENSEKNVKAATFYLPHSNSLSLLGFALLNIREYDLAIKEFNFAINNTPSYYLPYKGLGKVYMETGHKDKAIENFEKAVKLNDLDGESRDLLGQLKLNNYKFTTST